MSSGAREAKYESVNVEYTANHYVIVLVAALYIKMMTQFWMEWNVLIRELFKSVWLVFQGRSLVKSTLFTHRCK